MRGRSNRVTLEIKRAAVPFVAWIALCVCAALALGWVLTNEVFQAPWKSYTYIRAAFGSVKGVLPGQQEVRLAGVRVGVIESESLVHGIPVLTLAVEQKYGPVYRNAHLELRPQTPLDDMYVSLWRGTSSAGPLPAGAILPLWQTGEPVDAGDVLQAFNASTRTELRNLLVGFGKGMGDGGASLNAAFAQAVPFLDVARQVATEIAVRRGRLAQLVSLTGQLTGAIGERDRQLTGLIRSSDSVLAMLARQDVPFGPMLHALPATLTALQTAFTNVGQARTMLDPALVALRPAAQALDPALSALSTISGELRPAARALDPAVTSLVPLAGSLPPLSRGLASSLGTLRPQVPDFSLVTRQLAVCQRAYRDFFIHTLSLFKLNDNGQALGRGEVTVGPLISTRTGPAPSQVGLSKPQQTSSSPLSLGQKRQPSCTEQAGLSTIPSANLTGG